MSNLSIASICITKIGTNKILNKELSDRMTHGSSDGKVQKSGTRLWLPTLMRSVRVLTSRLEMQWPSEMRRLDVSWLWVTSRHEVVGGGAGFEERLHGYDDVSGHFKLTYCFNLNRKACAWISDVTDGMQSL